MRSEYPFKRHPSSASDTLHLRLTSTQLSAKYLTNSSLSQNTARRTDWMDEKETEEHFKEYIDLWRMPYAMLNTINKFQFDASSLKALGLEGGEHHGQAIVSQSKEDKIHI